MMNYKIWLTIAAIPIGILFAQTNFFGLIQLSFVLFIVFIIALLSLIVALFKGNYKVESRHLLFLRLVFLTGIIMFLCPNFFALNKRLKTQDLIIEIEAYKKVTGHYPASLEDLDEKNREKGIYYSVDSTLKYYTLSYGLDGWHHRNYSSEDKKWTVND